MNENNKDFEKEYDSFKDVAEFQNNMFNPGHYIGTGKVPPTVSAPGNAAPMAVFCFITSAGIFAFGLWLFFSDARVVSSGLIESPLMKWEEDKKFVENYCINNNVGNFIV